MPTTKQYVRFVDLVVAGEDNALTVMGVGVPVMRGDRDPRTSRRDPVPRFS